MRELTLPDLEIYFSAYLNAIQLVALVSPTRTPCLFGARVVRDIFQRWKTPRYADIWSRFLYKRPTPDFWMHQLNERPDLLLDPDRLMAEVQKAIEATLKG